MRRIGWFERLVRRFDLISFQYIADELARDRGSVDRSSARREQAYRDLGDSIMRGEFGRHKPGRRTFAVVVRMPNFPERRANAGAYPLRVSLAQVERLLANDADPEMEFMDGCTRYSELGEFWTPRSLLQGWFAARPT